MSHERLLEVPFRAQCFHLPLALSKQLRELPSKRREGTEIEASEVDLLPR